MKKKKSLLICFLVLLLSISLLLPACSDTDETKIERVEVYVDGLLVTADTTLTFTYGDNVEFANNVVVKTVATDGTITELPKDSSEYSLLNVPGIFNAGEYTIQVKYGEMTPETFKVKINPKTVAAPSGAQIFNYSGALQTYTPQGFDAATMTLSGNTGTNCGSGTAIVELKDKTNYRWVDGTTDTVELDWSIASVDPQYLAPGGLQASIGQTLSNVTLPTAENGTWTWNNPQQAVGSAGENVHTATFTPTDTVNYNTINNVEVTVFVGKTNPTYTLPTGLTANYGSFLSDVILPFAENGVWTWEASGASVGDAGANQHNLTFTPHNLNDYNIMNNLAVTVTVSKIAPSYDLPLSLTATYGSTLSDVTLPTVENGTWSWETPSTALTTLGETYCTAVFTPTNANYNTVEESLLINVTMATYTTAPTVSLTGTYSPTQKLSDIDLPTGFSWLHPDTVPTVTTTAYPVIYNANPENYFNYSAEATLVLAKADVQSATHVALSGTYSPAFTLNDYSLNLDYYWVSPTTIPTVDVTSYPAKYNPDPENYNDYPLNVTLTLSKAAHAAYGETAPTLTATYSPTQTLADIELPENLYWVDATIIPTVAVSTYAATYNTDTVNYAGADVTITINVARASYSNVTHSAITGRTYNPSVTLAGVTLNSGFCWVDDSITPTCTVTEYAAKYNADSANYNDFALSISIILQKAPASAPSHRMLTGTYSPTVTLSAYTLDEYYSWVTPSEVPNCDKYYYNAIYNNDPDNYADDSLFIELGLEKGNYESAPAHVALSGVYDPNKQLLDYTLSTNYDWYNIGTVPTCDVTEYDAYYNADSINYYNKPIKITLILQKADYSDIIHHTFYGTYSPNETLANYYLTAFYTWADSTIVPTCDKNDIGYAAIYNADNINYNNFELNVKIELEKATYPFKTHADILGRTYSPNTTLASVTLDEHFSWEDDTIVPTCDKNDTGYAAIYNVDSINYNDYPLVIKIILSKVTPSIPTGLTGIAGKAVSTVTLPSGANGSWSWENDAVIMNVADTSFAATFTPTDTVNYNSVTKDIPVTVSQLTLTVVNGTIVGSDNTTESYDYNTSVSVSHTLKEKYYFIGWQQDGNTVNTNTSYTFNLTESVTLTAVSEEIVVTAIAPFAPFSVKDYPLNASLDTSGMSILVSYNHGLDKVIDVLASYVSGFDTSSSGNEKTATVMYEGKTFTFTYNVVLPVLQSIELHLEGWNDFSIGDPYCELDDNATPDDPTDDTWYYAIVLLLIYDYDLDSELYPSRVDVTEAPEGFSTENVGQFTTTVNYGGKSCQYSYTVFPNSFDRADVPHFFSVQYGTLLSDLAIASFNTSDYTWAWKDDTATVGDTGLHFHTATCTFTADGATLDYDLKMLVNPANTPAAWYANVPTGLTATYGQVLGDVDVSAFNNEFGTWVWKALDFKFPRAQAYNIEITFEPKNNNYIEVTRYASIVVGKADLPDELVPTTRVISYYGRKLSDISFLSYSGTYAWNEVNPADTTYVGDIGTNTFRADYTYSENYNARVVDVIVEVRAADLSVPTGTDMPSFDSATYEKITYSYPQPLSGGIVRDGYGAVVEGIWTIDELSKPALRDSGITFTPANTTRYNVLKTTFDAAVSNFYKAIDVTIIRAPEVEFYYGEQGSRQLLMFGKGLLDITFEDATTNSYSYTMADVLPSGENTYLNAATPNYAVRFIDDVISSGHDLPRGALITTEAELIDAIALTGDESTDSIATIAYVNADITLTANIATDYRKYLVIAEGATLDLDEYVISFNEYHIMVGKDFHYCDIAVHGTLTSNHGDSTVESIVNLYRLTNNGHVTLKQIGTETHNYYIENNTGAVINVDTLECNNGYIYNYGTINASGKIIATDITNRGTINAIEHGVTITEGGHISFYVDGRLNGELHLMSPMSPFDFYVYNADELANAFTYSNKHLGNSNVHIFVEANIDLTDDDRFVDYNSTEEGIKLLIHADNNGGLLSSSHSLVVSPCATLNLGGKTLGLDFMAKLDSDTAGVTMDQTCLASIENKGTISNGYIVYNVNKCYNTLTRADFLLGSGTYPADEFISEGGGNTLYALSSNQLERALAFDGFTGKSLTVVMSADEIGPTFTYTNITNSHILPAGFELVLIGTEWKTANTGYKATITLSKAEGALPAAKLRLPEGAKIVNTDFIVEEIDATSLITVDSTSVFGEEGNLNSIEIGATTASLALNVMDGSWDYTTPIITVYVTNETELDNLITDGSNIPNGEITAALIEGFTLTSRKELGKIKLMISAGVTLNGDNNVLSVEATENSTNGVPIQNYGTIENCYIDNTLGVALQRSQWTSFGGTFVFVELFNEVYATVSSITSPSTMVTAMNDYVSYEDGLATKCYYNTNGMTIQSMGTASFKPGMILHITGNTYIDNGTNVLTFEAANETFYAYVQNDSAALIGLTSAIHSSNLSYLPKDAICNGEGTYDVTFTADVSVTSLSTLSDVLEAAESNLGDSYSITIASDVTLQSDVVLPYNVLALKVAAESTLDLNGNTLTFSNPLPTTNYFPAGRVQNAGTITNGALNNTGFAYGLFRYESGTYSSVTLTQKAISSQYNADTLGSKLLQKPAFFDAGSYAGTTSNGLKAYLSMTVDETIMAIYDFTLNAGATLTVNEGCTLTPYSADTKITFGYESDTYAAHIVNNATTGGVSGFIVGLTHINQSVVLNTTKYKILRGEGNYSDITADYVYTAIDQNNFAESHSAAEYEQTDTEGWRPSYVTIGNVKIIVAESFETVYTLPVFFADIEIKAGVTLTVSDNLDMANHTIIILSDPETSTHGSILLPDTGYPITLSSCSIVAENLMQDEVITIAGESNSLSNVTFNGDFIG